MPLNITSRHFDLADADRAHIETKVDRFRKLIDQISVLDVVIDSEKNHYNVELIIKARQFEAAGKETNGDLRSAIDRVISKVERQLHKQIEKRRTVKRHSREARDRRSVTLTLPLLADLEGDQDERGIIRTERIAAKPMSVEEAAEQLEVEAGAFLVFTNPETETINIIYRRDDGNFGLIEPS
jgi:putative sigma-54 modulation protein